MEKEQLKDVFVKAGCSSNLQKTTPDIFTEVPYNSFNKKEFANRGNASWKTAQYVIVNDCTDSMSLLTKWKALAQEAGNQFLLIFNKLKKEYSIYDSDANHVGTDAVLENLIKNNRVNYSQKSAPSAIASKSECNGDNIILYGVPGCGKSWHVENHYATDDTIHTRVVFHPDYTNADFIGQILPQTIVNANNPGTQIVTYTFKPGPFTDAIKSAVQDKSGKKHVLVIEEINRGNAAAIFGEAFQLLDRIAITDNNPENLPIGTSKYGINNINMAKEIYGNETTSIRIPPNLSIVATMNTSDQNVFTLDTAFKRRWKMRCIPNDFNQCKLRTTEICGLNTNWSMFAKTINEIITELNASGLSSEDKRLGAYFVTAEELADKDLFAEKILSYLWDDVFKFNRNIIFKPEIKTLEILIEEFKKNGLSIFTDLYKTTCNRLFS